MKRFVGILLVLLLITGFSALLYADAGVAKGEAGVIKGGAGVTKGKAVATEKSAIKAYRLQIGEKAARGVKNILLGWTELPKRVINKTKETGNPIWGLIAGTYEGALKAVWRTFSGVSDVLTAPANPTGEPYIPVDMEKLKL